MTKRLSQLRNTLVLLTVAGLVSVHGRAQAATVDLSDWGLNLDGTSWCLIGPCDFDGLFDLSGVAGVDDSAFDFSTGLGRIGVTLSGAGDHFVGLFVDHAIDESTSTFFNEVGEVHGAPVAGQSWEIDEPGFLFGDIFDHVADSDEVIGSQLDNTNGVPPGLPDDVSMALGFDFTLAAGEIAVFDFLLSNSAIPSGFYLSHTDPDSTTDDATIFFSAAMNVQSSRVPEPSTLVLVSLGLGGMGFSRRKALRRLSERTT